MTDLAPPRSELILNQTEDGRNRIQCRFEDEALRLTQAQMAELFQTTPQNISRHHLQDILAERELAEEACKDLFQIRPDGSPEVSRSHQHYWLAPVLALSIRVRKPSWNAGQ